MNKKSQVVVVTLWILVVLTVLAVSIAHRVSLGLRLCRYQRDSVRALYLAKAGLSLAIRQLVNDNSPVSLLEDISGVTRSLEITDEERKININTADSCVLDALFKECGLNNAEAHALAHDILIYRGVEPMDESANNSGYFFKGANFTSIEEFFLLKGVKEIESQKQENLKALITVFGDGKININTAGPRVINILINAAIAKLALSGTTINTQPDVILAKFTEFRANKDFSSTDLVNMLGLTDPADIDLINICNALAGYINIKSQNFAINVTANIINSKLTRKITCVYKRDSNKIIFWHEN